MWKWATSNDWLTGHTQLIAKWETPREILCGTYCTGFFPSLELVSGLTPDLKLDGQHRTKNQTKTNEVKYDIQEELGILTILILNNN